MNKAMVYAVVGAMIGTVVGMVVSSAMVNFGDAGMVRLGGIIAIALVLVFAFVGYRQGRAMQAGEKRDA